MFYQYVLVIPILATTPAATRVVSQAFGTEPLLCHCSATPLPQYCTNLYNYMIYSS